MRKLISVLTAIFLLVACLPLGAVSVSADTSGTTGDCTWVLDGTHLTISGNGPMADYEWRIEGTFPWDKNITSVTIKDGVTTIGEYAFSGCRSLTSVDIPDSVTTIGDAAFCDCTSLQSVHIPASVTTIGSGAFFYCTSVSAFTVDEDNLHYCSEDGVLFNKGKTELMYYPAKSTASSYVIPDSVTIIGRDAFSDCTSLTSVDIPASVTTIGFRAFGRCETLTDVHYHGTKEDRAKISIGSYNEKLEDATWHYYDNSCDVDCNDCGIIRDPIHKYNDVCDRDCNVCGATRIAPHAYDGDCDSECNICGFHRKPGEHTYDNSCDVDCNYCGFLREILEHTYSDACDADCNDCGVKREPLHEYTGICDDTCDGCGWWREAADHEYVAVVTAPTCTEDGYTTYTCIVCGDSYDAEVVKAPGHVSDTVADCVNDEICIVCGEVLTDAFGHIFEEKVTAPTCTEDGYTTYTCIVCGDSYDAEVIPAIGNHVYDDDYDSACNVCGDIREVPERPDPTVIYGDADGNGRVNNRDLGLLQQYINEYDVTVVKESLDMDGNGRINNRDLGLLQQYINSL